METENEQPLRFALNLNVLRHLGIQLYASTPSVITEVVANSWDAEATNVSITIEADEFTIIDDGHGMTRGDVQNRFLNVGYNRRELDANGGLSKSRARKVMGRKGIGKLALFSLAEMIEVHTQHDGSRPVMFRIDVKELSQRAQSDHPYFPDEIRDPPQREQGFGTTIRLSRLKTNASRAESYLRPRLARRFGVIGPSNGFEVSVNGTAISRSEARLYDDLQFLWYFDEDTRDEALRFATRLAKIDKPDGHTHQCVASLNSTIVRNGQSLKVSGFIGTVDKPSRLGRDEESINQIALFARGRLFQEDLLSFLGDAGVFNTYIVGEVHADFLDDDGIDRATSAREAVIRNDPLVGLVMSHVKDALRTVRDGWDEWRSAVKLEEAGEIDVVLSDWLDSLPDARDKRQAKKLLNSISHVEVSNDEARNLVARRMLYRSAIVGFEKLRVRRNLDALGAITDVFSPEFQALFSNIDDIEETYFRDISGQRLEVIDKFENYVNSEQLEKVVQDYLFDHLWLLDPNWDRIGGTQQKEITLTDYLKAACPESEEGSRLDLAYRLQSGRHVVVELKRPGVTVSFDRIISQCNRYRRSVNEYMRQHSQWIDGAGDAVPVVIYFLMSTKPKLDEQEENSLATLGVKIVTYQTMILSARAAYEEYFRKRADAGRLQSVLDKL